MSCFYPKLFTVMPHIHPFTHRRRCQPCEVATNTSGAVGVRRRLAQGHHLTSWRGMWTCQPGMWACPHSSPAGVVWARLVQSVCLRLAVATTGLQQPHSGRTFTFFGQNNVVRIRNSLYCLRFCQQGMCFCGIGA